MMKKVVWCSFDGADSPYRQSSGCIQDLRAGTCTLVELDTDSSKIRSDWWNWVWKSWLSCVSTAGAIHCYIPAVGLWRSGCSCPAIFNSDQWPELTGQSFPVAAKSLRGASASSCRGQAYALAEER